MSFEQPLPPSFTALTARLREDLERQLNAAIGELTEQAEALTQTLRAEQAAALAEAVRAAHADAEQQAQERQQTLLADTDARLRESIEQVEARNLEQIESIEARHRAQLEEVEAAHRATREELEARQLTERDEADARHRQALADAEQRVQELLGEQHAALEQSEQVRLTDVERAIADAEDRLLVSTQAADLAAGGRLVKAFRAIDEAQSLSDILNTVATAIATEAPRSAIFLAGNAQVKSWRAHGFDPVDAPLAECGIVATALELCDTVHGGADHDGLAPTFAALTADRAAVAVPMIVNGEVVAIAYADQGTSGEVDRASWAAIVELLARHASRSLDAITARGLARRLGAGATRPRTVAKPADVVTMPLVSSAPLPFPFPAAVPGRVHNIESENAAAQSYAQTLISEIRASHESDVLAGLRERDLMTRLGGPISRAWAQYEAKVPESIRAATNYFHAEMVRTLADGDASLLSPRA